VDDDGFRFALEIAEGFTGALSAIEVEGPALSFSLTTDIVDRATLGVPGLQAARLGGRSGMLDQLATGGDYSGLGDNTSMAVRIVDEALAKLTRVEGLVDGFAERVVASSATLLAEFDENLGDAIDTIDLVDDEKEAALLARNEALMSNAVTALASLASQQQLLVDLFRSAANFRPR
jgi:hypothetical protein